MKVMVSKTMVNKINAFFKTAGIKYHAAYVEMPLDRYLLYVGSGYDNKLDFKPSVNKMKAIRIEYPPSMFAMNRFVTTNDLSKIFHKSDKTLDGFMKELYAEVEI